MADIATSTLAAQAQTAPSSAYPLTRALLAVQIGAGALGVFLCILPIWRGLEMEEVDTFLMGVLAMSGCLIWATIALVGRAVLDIADNTRKQTAKGGIS